MATREKTLSEQWREKGNEAYQGAGTEGLSPTLQAKRLEEALSSYSRALSLAQDDGERSSACKNLAMGSWRMAKTQSTKEKISTFTFYYKEALRRFSEAKTYGSRRDAEWQGSLADAAGRCWAALAEEMREWEPEVRVRELHELLVHVIDDITKARGYLEITNHYFYWGLLSLAARDYHQSLTLFKECHFPLMEASRLSRSSLLPLKCECWVLEEDIYTQTCVAESIQERVRGETMLSQVIRDEEILNIDMIWEVVDSFRLAAQLTRGRDLEMEAMALSALGRVYDQVLMQKDRAKAVLKNVLELVNTMVPRNFSGEEWYEFARSTLERYQQANVRTMQEKEQKEKQEVLDLIKDDLETLMTKQEQRSKLGFLQFVYATYPPKNPNHKMGEVSGVPTFSELRKLYLKAVIHYHPDRVDVEQHGKKWKVLSEEITKLLTCTYEFFKSCDLPPPEAWEAKEKDEFTG